jgi:hypothetical protein
MPREAGMRHEELAVAAREHAKSLRVLARVIRRGFHASCAESAQGRVGPPFKRLSLAQLGVVHLMQLVVP